MGKFSFRGETFLVGREEEKEKRRLVAVLASSLVLYLHMLA